MVKMLLTVVFSLLIAGCAGSPLSNAVNGNGFRCTMDSCADRQPQRAVDWAGYVCVANRCDPNVQPTTRPTDISGAVSWVAYRQHYLGCNAVANSVRPAYRPAPDSPRDAGYQRALQIAEQMGLDMNDVHNHPFLQHKIRERCISDQRKYAEVLQSCRESIESSAMSANRILARYGMPHITNADITNAILAQYVTYTIMPNSPHNAAVNIKVDGCRVSITMD